MRLQEGIVSKLNALAKESKKFEAFKKAAKEISTTITDAELRDIYDAAHEIAEALSADADTGEYIKDFEKSKAPQFKGKSKKKRREMAIAASMSSKKGKLTKEDILKAVKEVLAEGQLKTYAITPQNKAEAEKELRSKGYKGPVEPNTSVTAEDHNLDPADESSMAKSELYSIAKYAIELMKMIEDGEQLDAWVQSKITKAADYVNSVKRYMEGEKALSEAMSDPDITVVGLQNHLVRLNQELKYYQQKGGEADLRYVEMLKQDIAKAQAELDRRLSKKDEIQTDMFAAKASKTDSGKETYFKFLRAFAKSAGKSEEELGKMSYNDLEKEFGEKLARKHGLKQRNVADRARELVDKGIIQTDEIEEAKKKLDAVGKEDSDINNDGKVDKTDKYLKGRRVKIGQAIAQYKKK